MRHTVTGIFEEGEELMLLSLLYLTNQKLKPISFHMQKRGTDL